MIQIQTSATGSKPLPLPCLTASVHPEGRSKIGGAPAPLKLSPWLRFRLDAHSLGGPVG